MEKNSWYCCPICGKKLVKLEPGSIMYGVPVYCRSKTCKVAHYPSISWCLCSEISGFISWSPCWSGSSTF